MFAWNSVTRRMAGSEDSDLAGEISDYTQNPSMSAIA